MCLQKWCLHRNWNLDRPEVAKVILIQTNLEIPTFPSRKLQLWILVSGSELTLSYYHRTLTLKNLCVYSLHWFEFFHQDLHRQLFSLKNAFLFFKSNCCTFNLSFRCRLDGKCRSATAPLVSNLNLFCSLKFSFTIYNFIWLTQNARFEKQQAGNSPCRCFL